MKNKTCVITGANSGIGYFTSLTLASLGAHVIMVCRNKERGEKAQKDIIKLSKNDKVELFLCDFAYVDSIRAYIDILKQQIERIDVVINNAGVLNADKRITEQGLEETFAINHLGYFSHTLLLLQAGLLREGSRIINISSVANNLLLRIRMGDYNFESRRYNGVIAYAQSKLYNIMFTFYLAKKLQKKRITVNAVHPGFIKSKIYIGGFLLKLLMNFLKLFAKPQKEGASAPVYIAKSPDLENVTGKYFKKKKQAKANKIAYDEEKQKELWQMSLRVTGIEDPFDDPLSNVSKILD